jgi:hypothetical protein
MPKARDRPGKNLFGGWMYRNLAHVFGHYAQGTKRLPGVWHQANGRTSRMIAPVVLPMLLS